MANTFKDATANSAVGEPVTGAYLTVTEARSLGLALAKIPGANIDALMAEDDVAISAILLEASLDIDNAFPFQGCKYDLTGAQIREFPRYANVGDYPSIIRTPGERMGNMLWGFPGVWDWDATLNKGIVPDNVKRATMYQAGYLLDPKWRDRLDAIRSGVTSTKIGSFSEDYTARGSHQPGGVGGVTGLCDRAQRLMERYRLKSGGLL